MPFIFDVLTLEFIQSLRHLVIPTFFMFGLASEWSGSPEPARSRRRAIDSIYGKIQFRFLQSFSCSSAYFLLPLLHHLIGTVLDFIKCIRCLSAICRILLRIARFLSFSHFRIACMCWPCDPAPFDASWWLLIARPEPADQRGATGWRWKATKFFFHFLLFALCTQNCHNLLCCVMLCCVLSFVLFSFVLCADNRLMHRLSSGCDADIYDSNLFFNL